MTRSTFLSTAAAAFLLAGSDAAASTMQEAGRAAKRKKVLILGVDGTRPDALKAARAPHLKSIAESGAYSYAAQTGAITFSGPGWSSMLTGVGLDKHGVRDNSFRGEHFEQYPHLFRRLKQSDDKWRTYSIVQWAPINYWIVSNADYARTCTTDADVAADGARALREEDPDVLFLHFDGVDHAGHTYGFGPETPQYMAAIETVDNQVGTVLASLKARKNYADEDWLIISSTDHGGQGKTHGPNTPICRTTFLFVSGSSAARGEITPAPVIVDVAATALAHLGVAIKPEWSWDGHPVGLSTAKV